MIMTTADKKNWIETLLDFVKSENKYRNAFMVYFLIWNYDFVLVFIGKSHILDEIQRYHFSTYPNWLFHLYNNLCFYCGTFIVNKIVMPSVLAFIMPIIWNVFNSFYQSFEVKSQKLKKENLITENTILKDKIETMKASIIDISKEAYGMGGTDLDKHCDGRFGRMNSIIDGLSMRLGGINLRN